MSVETPSSDGFRAATVKQLIADQRDKGLRLVAGGRLFGGSGGDRETAR
jgi:hypothetical protein